MRDKIQRLEKTMHQARNETSFDQTAHQLPASSPSIFEHHGAPSEIGSLEPSCSDRETGVLSTYLHQIGNIPRLTADEEIGLFIKIEKSRKEIEEYYRDLARFLPDLDPRESPTADALTAQLSGTALAPSSRRYLFNLVQQMQVVEERIRAVKGRIVEANLRLAVCIAKKYRERGLDLLDLIQEANIGLMSAIDRFDCRRNVKFSAYASWWIQQSIGCGITNNGRTVRLPAHVLDTSRKVEHAKSNFQQEGVDEPSLAKLAETTGLTIEKIVQSVQLTPFAVSLDACTSMESCGAISDALACEKTPDPLMEVIDKELIEEVRAAVTTLPLREKQIADLRYGLQDGDQRSLQEVGTMLDLSRERIRQLETRFLDRLRHPARSEKLRGLLDL